MDEQKRLLLAIVLSVVVLIGYQTFFVKSPDPGRIAQPDQNNTQQEQLRETPNVTEYKATAASPA